MSRPGDLNNLFTMGLRGPEMVICALIAVPIWLVYKTIRALTRIDASTWLHIGLLALIPVVLISIAWLIVEYENRETAQLLKKADIIERAESQHARLMDGDESALYGNYPPADL